MKYLISHIWDGGRRSTNEDSLAILSVRKNNIPIVFAIVADGIGSFSNGELASGLIVSATKSAFEKDILESGNISLKHFVQLLRRELYRSHHVLKNYSDSINASLGSTVSLVCLIRNRGFAMNIGDSHIYHIRASHRRPNTIIGNSHTDSRGRLTRCIGYGPFFHIKVFRIHLHIGDTLLLCTDGLYKKTESAILNLSLNSISATYLNNIKNTALKAGEKDNISAISITCMKGEKDDK